MLNKIMSESIVKSIINYYSKSINTVLNDGILYWPKGWIQFNT